jgi:ribosomal protein L12E/L44/L45/RPP1/RPP2
VFGIESGWKVFCRQKKSSKKKKKKKKKEEEEEEEEKHRSINTKIPKSFGIQAS